MEHHFKKSSENPCQEASHSSDLSEESALFRKRELDLYAIGKNLIAKKESHGITQIPTSSQVTVAQLRERFPTGKIIACDFLIDNVEELGTKTDYGYEIASHDIINVDHHANHPDMFRYLSSGNLAIEFVKRFGAQESSDVHIVVNHNDCDSVISSLIIRGLLPPHELFGEAVIAADHSGAEDEIADLLQSIDVIGDLNYSIEKLGLLFTRELTAGEKSSKSAVKALKARAKAREVTERSVKEGSAVLKEGALTVVQMCSEMRNEFLPPLFPDAAVVLTTQKMKSRPGFWKARFRLGIGAPKGFTLKLLEIDKNIDPAFGGRWNAGSNSRGGGTDIPLDEYIKKIDAVVRGKLSLFC